MKYLTASVQLSLIFATTSLVANSTANDPKAKKEEGQLKSGENGENGKNGKAGWFRGGNGGNGGNAVDSSTCSGRMIDTESKEKEEQIRR